MNKLLAVFVLLLLALSAVLAVKLVTVNRSRGIARYADLDAATIADFSRRADSLSRVVDTLVAKFDRQGLLKRPQIALQVRRLNQETDSLRRAVRHWKAANPTDERNEALRECMILYGRASVYCENLRLSPDSLP